MFKYYVLTVTLLYFLIVYIKVKTKSAVMVLMVFKDNNLLKAVPFRARDFGRGVHNAREKKGYSLSKFARVVGLPMPHLFLMEQGYKIPSERFLGFLIQAKEIIKFEGDYVISPSSTLMEWCAESCTKAVIESFEETPVNVKIIHNTTIPQVFVDDDLTFDEYIFKGHPMIFITTNIVSLRVEKLQEENKT